MIKLLCKLFIKDYKNIESKEVRTRYGVFVGIFGIITNFLLATLKIILGILSFSTAILADGINNLMDSLSSILTIIGFKLSLKKADRDHPFGHQRIEYITSLLIAVLIIVVGVSLFKDSLIDLIDLIKNNTTNYLIDNPWLIYISLIISILVKLYQFVTYRTIGKLIKSDTIKADSIDSFNDILTTTGVLLSAILFVTTKGKVNIDSVVGLLISLYICISGIMLVKSTIDPLLGSNPTQDDIERIISIIESYDGVLGVHDLIIHNYGPQTNYVTVHVEVRGDETVQESHELIDKIERDFKLKTGLILTIHMDPVTINDEETNEYYEITKDILQQINTNLTFHDFQVKHDDEHIILNFDVVIPDNFTLPLDTFKQIVKQNFKEKNSKFIINMTVDEAHNSFKNER